MNNITRFKFPMFVAAGLHGALFLNIPVTRPHVEIVDAVKPAASPERPTDIIELAEPEDTHTGSSASGGPAVSTLADRAVEKPRDTDFTIPVVNPKFIKGTELTLANPPLGPGGDSGPWTGVYGAPAGIVDTSALDRVPRATVQPSPDYPAGLRHEGVTGSVTVAFVVDYQGRVIRAEALKSTHQEFVAPAIRAVLKWRFEPGKINGRPTSFRMAVPIEFGQRSD